MRLLADCGNTAIKLAEHGAEGPAPARRVAVDAAELRAAVDAADELRVVASNPAAQDLLAEVWGGRQGLQRCGLELPVPLVGQYEGMGEDRILAGLAAVADGCSVVVVDCGTATTITAWCITPEGPRTNGGLILPGAEACAAGLHQRVPSLPLVAPARADAIAIQRTTSDAIAAGLGIGYPAMVERCLERVQAASGISRVVATGGAAEMVAPGVPYEPDLVLRGLAILG